MIPPLIDEEVAALTTIEDAVTHLLAETTHIPEERVHAVAFLCEWQALVEEEQRLTSAVFKRDAYGVFAPAVRCVLDQSSATWYTTYRGGHKARSYHTQTVSGADHTAPTRTIIETVHEACQSKTLEELGTQCRCIDPVRTTAIEDTLTLTADSLPDVPPTQLLQSERATGDAPSYGNLHGTD